MNEANLLSSDLVGHIGIEKYVCLITWRNGKIIMDEPVTIGGKDSGPDPYSTLLAALAGCTLSTLRMYIDRKGWQIPEIKVELNLWQENIPELITHIKRNIIFPDNILVEQKNRLLIIAGKCPVSKILENKVSIHSTA